MPEWMTTDLGVAGMMIGALAYVSTTYIKSKPSKKEDNSTAENICVNSVIPYLADTVRTNTELLAMLRETQEESKRSNEKQQEAMQGMILAINNLVSLSKETLDRVKEINRR